MAGRQQHYRQSNSKGRRSSAPPPPPLAVREHKAPVQYGKPFILLEDGQKNTFKFFGGAWVAYDRTIAQCKVNCQVKELDQKLNRMTRYEVRAPIEISA
jgi:hypothetical protein